jgi:hypothetical protein
MKDGEYPRVVPDLQDLVAIYGRYDLIPEEAWRDYHAAIAEWHRKRRIFTAGYCDQKDHPN